LRLNQSFPALLLFSSIDLTGCYSLIIKNSASPSVIGRPFAITISMILLIIRMKVHSEKRLELSQALASLSGSIRMEKGCRRCDLCQNVEAEDRLFLLEEWDTRVNLMTHLKSEHYRVLRGAMNLLQEPYERTFYTVYQPAGMKAVDKAGQSSGASKWSSL